MEPINLVILVIGICGFIIAFILQFQLNRYVSKERVHAVEDVSILWKNSIPPRIVLSEKGQKIHKIMSIGGYIFGASVVCNLILMIFT